MTPEPEDPSVGEWPFEKSHAWIALPPSAVPSRWRHRALTVSLISLTPEEAAQVRVGVGTTPELDARDAPLARLLARGVTIDAIAGQLGISVRGAHHRLARLRERFNVKTTAELRAMFAMGGFGSSLTGSPTSSSAD